MIRLTLRIKGDWRAAALLACLLMSIPLASSVAAREPAVSTPMPNAAAAYFPQHPGRHYYLTNANYATSVAKTACAAGYHMASLWEILDVSNLIYDYDHPAAHTKADSGYGPPSFWNGWVRTGSDSSGSTTTGSSNCLNWTSNSSADSGVTVRLSRTWETAPGDIFTWDATSWPCNIVGPVWYVGTFYSQYLPLVIKQ